MWEPYLLAREFGLALELAKTWKGPEFEVSRERFDIGEIRSAIAYRLEGRSNAAKETAHLALARLDSESELFPQDYRSHLVRALALSAAGERDEAVASAERSMQESPADAVENMKDRYQLARAMVLVGENERALEWLEPLLPGPSTVSVKYVELDPHWDSLREDSDFQALLDKYRDND